MDEKYDKYDLLIDRWRHIGDNTYGEEDVNRIMKIIEHSRVKRVDLRNRIIAVACSLIVVFVFSFFMTFMPIKGGCVNRKNVEYVIDNGRCCYCDEYEVKICLYNKMRNKYIRENFYKESVSYDN